MHELAFESILGKPRAARSRAVGHQIAPPIIIGRLANMVMSTVMPDFVEYLRLVIEPTSDVQDPNEWNQIDYFGKSIPQIGCVRKCGKSKNPDPSVQFTV